MSEPFDSSGLTFRQLRFVFEYLKDQNASAAAVRAGYSAATRASQGHELMNNDAVRERIRIELQSLLAEVQCAEIALIKERRRAAFFRAEKMFKGGWELRALDEMDEETRGSLEVTTIQRKSGPVVRLRQPDRNRALRALERVHERLEKLNEAHYAKLERQGRVKRLDEIEAMDQPEPATQFSEKSQVLSGSGQSSAAPGDEFPEKPQVLSGATSINPPPPAHISKKHQVLSGPADASNPEGPTRNGFWPLPRPAFLSPASSRG